MKKIKLVFQGWQLSHVGFAEASRNYILQLIKTGNYKIKTFPYDKDNVDLAKLAVVKKIKKFRGTLIKERPIWISETGPAQIMPNLGYAIGIVVWELKRWPRVFIKNLKHQNELWSPSKFVADGMKRNHLKNIHIVPHVVDTERFKPGLKKHPSVIERSHRQGGKLFKFLSIMGWSERKGVSDLLRAYIEEFSKQDNTLLYIKLNHYDIAKATQQIAKIRKKTGKPENKQPWIITDKKIYDWKEWPRIYADADCFVLASRGEGFGLNYAEAMASELPTISTKIPPMTEYIDETNGYLVNTLGEKKDRRCDWITPYYRGMKFPVISVRHLRKRMREVYSNPKKAEKKAKRARQDIIKKFSPKVVREIMDNRLQKIWKEMHHFKLAKPLSIKYFR